jgi:methenyltetrahydrofolate cyclohydrolase
LSARQWSEAPAAVERASRLRLDAEELVEADVQAYLGFVETRRDAKAGKAREAALASAFQLTVTVPQAIVQAAAAAVELAGELAEHGNPNLRADAVTAALLASAAGTAAAGLVAVNLADSSAESAG